MKDETRPTMRAVAMDRFGGPEVLKPRNLWYEVLEEELADRMARPFDLLLGRKTYEIFAAHWPYDEGLIAERLNSATKHVASRTLERLDWSNSTLIEGEVETAVPKLKAGDSPELQVHGSWNLIRGTDQERVLRVRGIDRAGDRAPTGVGRRLARRRFGHCAWARRDEAWGGGRPKAGPDRGNSRNRSELPHADYESGA